MAGIHIFWGEHAMATTPKTTEPGFFRKAIEWINGTASVQSGAASIDAYGKGNVSEGIRLAQESNREARDHLFGGVKVAASKVNGIIQNANVSVIKTLGGDEAGELLTKAFKAGDEGHGWEQTKLALKAEAKVPGHLYDEAKAEFGKLTQFAKDNPGAAIGSIGGVAGEVAGYEIQQAIQGGHHVTEHGGIQATPAKPATTVPARKP